MSRVDSLINTAALEYVTFDLPSRGLPYQGKPSIVKVRPTVSREEKFLKSIASTASNYEEKLAKYLMSITDLSEIGLPATNLTTGDQLSLLIFSRILAKDQREYPKEVTCPDCGKDSIIKIDLLNLNRTYLSEDFVEPISVFLEKHGLTVFCRLLRVKDQVALTEYHDQMRRVNLNDTIDPSTDSEGLYAYTIEKMMKGEEEIELSYSEKREFLQKVDSISYNLIVGVQNDYYHGYETKAPFECPYCAYKTTVSFDFGSDFFFGTASPKQ